MNNDKMFSNVIASRDVHTVDISLELLRPTPEDWNEGFNEYTEDKLEELCDSIQSSMLLNPLLVLKEQELGSNGFTYTILSGNNRKKAFELLNARYPDSGEFSKITCRVLDRNSFTDLECENMVIDSNVLQREYTPLQLARLLFRKSKILEKMLAGRRDGYGINQRLADTFELSRRSIYNYKSLLNLIEPFQKFLENEVIAVNLAFKLASFSVDEQEAIFNVVTKNNAKEVFTLFIKYKNKHKEVLLTEKIVDEVLREMEDSRSLKKSVKKISLSVPKDRLDTCKNLYNSLNELYDIASNISAERISEYETELERIKEKFNLK